ncbi:12792_t:CDS:1, partial [Racocetra fulgida]
MSRLYVIKEIDLSKLKNPKNRIEARREVELLKQLNWPGIVKFVESWEDHNGLITNKSNKSNKSTDFINSLQYSISQYSNRPERKLVLPQEYRVLNIVTEYMDGG